MMKWADFVISAVKKGSGLSNITHVQIHEDLEHGLTAPKLINKHELSSKIQKGVSFITIFKKNENEWIAGDMVRTYVKDGGVFIRTDNNKVTSDNLGALPTVDELEIVLAEIKEEEPKVITSTPKPEPILKPESNHEPEHTVEKTTTKIKENEGDYEYEDSRRELLAKEAHKVRYNKSMPKGWTSEPTEKEIIKNEVISIKEKLKQKESKEKEFIEYEKNYLKKFETDESESEKLKEKFTKTEHSKHEARISRRLELEKVSGKDYEKLLSETSKPKPSPEPKPMTKKVTETKDDIEEKSSVESRISGMFKRVISTKDPSTTIADDTRNFIRKRRIAPKPEPEPKPLEPKPKVNRPKLTSTNSDEDKKRVLLAKEALKSRSTKSLPKAKVVKEERKSKEVQKKEIAEIKAQAVADAKKQAEKETSTIVEKLQKQIDIANASLERLRKENEEIKRAEREAEEKAKREAEEKVAAEAKSAKEQLEREEAEEKAKREAEEKVAAEAKAAQEQLEKELAEAKSAKEQLEREEAEEKARIEAEEKAKFDLTSEIQKELQELRIQLKEVDEDEEEDPIEEIKKELAKLRKELDSVED